MMNEAWNTEYFMMLSGIWEKDDANDWSTFNMAMVCHSFA